MDGQSAAEVLADAIALWLDDHPALPVASREIIAALLAAVPADSEGTRRVVIEEWAGEAATLRALVPLLCEWCDGEGVTDFPAGVCGPCAGSGNSEKFRLAAPVPTSDTTPRLRPREPFPDSARAEALGTFRAPSDTTPRPEEEP